MAKQETLAFSKTGCCNFSKKWLEHIRDYQLHEFEHESQQIHKALNVYVQKSQGRLTAVHFVKFFRQAETGHSDYLLI